MKIPRSEWPRLGVFFHPDIMKKVEKGAKSSKTSMTRFVERIVVNTLEKRKAS